MENLSNIFEPVIISPYLRSLLGTLILFHLLLLPSGLENISLFSEPKLPFVLLATLCTKAEEFD